jgi:hypothetical protein
MNAEQSRLEEARTKKAPWKKWGPYLSERQWGTVREDYSESGDAWNYFTHGDTGAGVGASHQTGWTGAIARIGHLFASFKAHEILEQGKGKLASQTRPPRRKR